MLSSSFLTIALFDARRVLAIIDSFYIFRKIRIPWPTLAYKTYCNYVSVYNNRIYKIFVEKNEIKYFTRRTLAFNDTITELLNLKCFLAFNKKL